jgi:large subunit ribosomal protein L6
MNLPSGFSLKVERDKLVLTSPKGQASHYFDSTHVKVAVSGQEVTLEPVGKLTRQVSSAVRTTEAHLRNMAGGLETPYEKKLTLVYAHFPVSIEVKADTVLIKNFLGEKTPRKAKIAGSTKVKVTGQEISVEGPDKDDVGQTANNITKATRITNKDIRVFQDGIYYS